MNNSPAEILRTYFITKGLGPDQGSSPGGKWAVFFGHLPDIPQVNDNAICVYDTSGTRDGRIMRTGETISHPGFQVRVRGRIHSEVSAKIDEARGFLDEILRTKVTIGPTTYTMQSTTQTGTPIDIGPDPDDTKRREIFTQNGTITVSTDT